MPLRLAEELLLIALDDVSGKLRDLPERALDMGLAGALLIELNADGSLDASPEGVNTLGDAPPPELADGDNLRGLVLSCLATASQPLTLQHALARLCNEAAAIRRILFENLVGKGVLRRQEHRLLFVLSERRYPVINNREETEAITRIRRTVLGWPTGPGATAGPETSATERETAEPGEPTEPRARDVHLVALIHACGLGAVVFTPEELERHGRRIEAIGARDCVAAAVAEAIHEIQRAILEVRAYAGM